MTDQAGPGEAIVIHAVGNIAPARVERGEPVESLFSRVHQKIKEADISFAHLERIFSTRGCLQYRDHNTAQARVDPQNAKSLVFAGFNVISHAGNHCFSYGPEALLDSIDVIRGNGMKVIGAGKDIVEARRPAILERKGVKVGFLGYNSVLPVEYEAREGKPGCAPIHVATYFEAQGYQPGTPPKIITIAREDDLQAMEEDIRRLRNDVDVVIVSVHWGLDAVPGVIAMYQPGVGHRAVEAGADLVIGHHGNTIKGVEVYRGKAIFYSLGNFGQEGARRSEPPKPGPRAAADASSTHRKASAEERRYVMMVKCVINRKGAQKVSILPVWTNQRAEPEFLSRSDPRFEEVRRYIEPLCKELGTTLTPEGDELVVVNSLDG
ncbi:MAG: CapA family protein [Chloroflexi bacterium]|nr:CapA family protein [Chloroflexota bacterium]